MAFDSLQRTFDANSFRILNLGTPLAATDATQVTSSSGDIQSVGSANALGASFLAAPAAHVHQGLHSVKADSNTALNGDVTLASGTAVSLTQSGQTITVSSPYKDWLEARKSRAATLMNVSGADLGCYDHDIDRSGGYTTGAASPGVATFTGGNGGTMTLSSSTTASKNARLVNSSSAITVAPTTERFHVASHTKLTTAGDANSKQVVIGVSFDDTYSFDDCAALWVKGSTLYLANGDGGTLVETATSWTVDTSSFHTFEVGWDLTTMKVYVDDVLVLTLASPTHVSPDACHLVCYVQNGATAANREEIVDKWCLITKKAA